MTSVWIVVFIYLPFVCITLFYIKIRRIAVGHLNAITQQGQTDSGATNSASLTKKKDMKILKTIGLILGSYVLSWMPLMTSFLVYTLTSKDGTVSVTYYHIHSSLFVISVSNAVQNPLVYVLVNRDFKHAFLQILCCGRKGNNIYLGNNTGQH